jgi:hypothetical protein
VEGALGTSQHHTRWTPGKPGPLGKLDALVHGGQRRRRLAPNLQGIGQVPDHGQLGTGAVGLSRPLPRLSVQAQRRSKPPLALFQNGQGRQCLGLLLAAASRPGRTNGLCTPAPSRPVASGVPERQRQRAAGAGSQPGRRLVWDEPDRLLTGW